MGEEIVEETAEEIQELVDVLTDEMEKRRVEVRDLYWKDKTIKLDGYRFVNCRFENCILVFRWPDFELHKCHFVGTRILPSREHDRETA